MWRRKYVPLVLENAGDGRANYLRMSPQCALARS